MKKQIVPFCPSKRNQKPPSGFTNLTHLLVQNRLAVVLAPSLLTSNLSAQTVLTPKGVSFVQHLLRFAADAGLRPWQIII
jgi:hypothetical protein